MKHGTRWTYQLGCRCPLCVTELRVKNRKFSQDFRDRQLAMRSIREHAEHGTCRWCSS